MGRVLAAFDKFRHTATADQLGRAVGDVAWEYGWDCKVVPLADGGEGTLEALAATGGTLRSSRVHDALGRPVDALWLDRGRTAFIEMARASGLQMVGGAEHNDPLEASTRGTGELITAALSAGAARIVVTLGGSATTDGGFGAIEAMRPTARFKGIELVVACDVETRFTDAARVFGPQKGATDAQVELLTRRLQALADRYLAEFGVDVAPIDGTGAAGGLAGGLVAVGARLESGFSLVADEVGLADHMDRADVVVTGEGFMDAESFHGKVVGGVVAMAAARGLPVVVVCGARSDALVMPEAVHDVVALSERFGKQRSWNEPLVCIREGLGPVLAPLLA